MKKIMCILLVMVCAGMAFAQAKPAAPAAAPAAPAPAAPAPAAAPEAAPAAGPKKNCMAIDLFPLLKGMIASDSSNKISYFFLVADYESLIAPHLSIGANLNTYFGKLDDTPCNYFSLVGEFRIYPDSESFEKLFFGTTFGFNMLSIDGKSNPDNGGFTGLTTSLKTGYKMITSKGLYLEPSLSYVLSKTSEIGGLGALLGFSLMPTPLGWEGGFRLGWTF